ncbi:MAG: hypothetical protein ABW098_08215 [Candidatus Thiodiazotropha sp.]
MPAFPTVVCVVPRSRTEVVLVILTVAAPFIVVSPLPPPAPSMDREIDAMGGLNPTTPTPTVVSTLGGIRSGMPAGEVLA